MLLVASSGAASLASPPKCCEGTAGVSQVLLEGLTIPLGSSISPRQGMLLSLFQAAAKPEPCWAPGITLAVLLDEGLGIPPGLGDVAKSPQRFCTPRHHGFQALHNHQSVLMMERQIYDAKEQPLEPRGDCGRGFNNPAVGLEFALQLLACLPGFSKKTSVAGGKK